MSKTLSIVFNPNTSYVPLKYRQMDSVIDGEYMKSEVRQSEDMTLDTVNTASSGGLN